MFPNTPDTKLPQTPENIPSSVSSTPKTEKLPTTESKETITTIANNPTTPEESESPLKDEIVSAEDVLQQAHALPDTVEKVVNKDMSDFEDRLTGEISVKNQ